MRSVLFFNITLHPKKCFFQIVKQEENIRTKMEKETRCRNQVLSKCNNTYVLTHYFIINTFVSLHNLSNCSYLILLMTVWRCLRRWSIRLTHLSESWMKCRPVGSSCSCNWRLVPSCDMTSPCFSLRLVSSMEGDISIYEFVLALHTFIDTSKFITSGSRPLTLVSWTTPKQKQMVQLMEINDHSSYWISRKYTPWV